MSDDEGQAPRQAVDLSAPTFSSEDIVDKLKLLDYEQGFCEEMNFKPVWSKYFSTAASNPNEQFHYFTSICSWLFGKCGVNFKPPGQFDDPNASASSLLDALRKAKLPADFPPAKVKAGQGEVACAILTALVDRALQSGGFEILKPVYSADDYEEEIPVEDDDVVGEIDDHMAASSSDEEEEYVAGGKAKDVGKRKEEETREAPPPLEEPVDPAEWQLEIERVAPMLKLRVDGDNKEWRTHVEMTKELHAAINTAMPSTKQQLDKIAASIGQSLDSISTREKYINSQYDSLVQEYRTMKEQLHTVSQKHDECAEGVSERTNELARITDELDSIKGEMDEKGKNMTETGPLVKLKDAMKKLRRELRDMELRIGTVSHSLLQTQLKNRSGLTFGNDENVPPTDADHDGDDF